MIQITLSLPSDYLWTLQNGGSCQFLVEVEGCECKIILRTGRQPDATVQIFEPQVTEVRE